MCLLKELHSFNLQNFTNYYLSVNAVYKIVVLDTLLYGPECWAVKAGQIRHLKVFHHRCTCVRCILGVTRHRQWTEHLSDNTLLREFGIIIGL